MKCAILKDGANRMMVEMKDRNAVTPNLRMENSDRRDDSHTA